jgi:NAD(P)H-flavin reductase
MLHPLQQIPVVIDGPYGIDHELGENLETIILLAGGIGVSRIKIYYH